MTELTPALIMQPLQVMLIGTVDSAHRALQVVHQVLNHGCALGPFITTVQRRSKLRSRALHPSISAPTTPKDYHEVIRLIWENGTTRRYCFEAMPAATNCPSELRAMEWQEITDDQLWRIPADKMKRRRDHVVLLIKRLR